MLEQSYKTFKQQHPYLSSCSQELYRLFDLIKLVSGEKKTCLIAIFADLCSGSFAAAARAHQNDLFHTIALTPESRGEEGIFSLQCGVPHD